MKSDIGAQAPSSPLALPQPLPEAPLGALAGALAGAAVAALDFAIVLICANIHGRLSIGVQEGAGTPALLHMAGVATPTAVCLVALLHSTRHYTLPALAQFLRQAQAVTLVWGCVAAAFMAAGLAPAILPGMAWNEHAAFFAITLMVLLEVRALEGLAIARWTNTGRLRRKALVVGTDRSVEALIEHYGSNAQRPVDIAGAFVESAGKDRRFIRNVEILGSPDGSAAFCREHHIDDVLVVVPMTGFDGVRPVIEQLRMLPVQVHLVLPDLGVPTRCMAFDNVGGLPAIRLADRPIKGWSAVVKRAEDLAVAGTALALLAPVMLLIALAIKIDSPGPVLFRQQRFGFNGRSITVLKFRTMYVDRCDPSGAARTLRNDPRVSALGRFLRKYSLDELPQLINVVRGEMSVVGPRAHSIAMKAGDQLYHEAVANYAARHRVHPGLTGWAQVNGLRGEIDSLEKARARVEYDLEYIDNWSLWLDLRILVKTALILLNDKNAY